MKVDKGHELDKQAHAAVRQLASEGQEAATEAATSAVTNVIDHYRKRAGFVIKTYPLVAGAIFILGYGIGSGAKWASALF